MSSSIVKSAVHRGATIIEINPESEIELGNTYTIQCFAENAVPQICKSVIKQL